MAKIFGGFDPESYATVAERVRLFYATHPLGRIHTELVSRTAEAVVFKASVYRTPDDERPAATGWAAEREGDGEINLVACLENTETSAIGRALANLGLTASVHRPSREEMEKANRERAQRVAEAGPARLTIDPQSPAALALHRRADRVMDVLDLLGQAERVGLTPKRARRFRMVLTDPRVSDAIIERVERALRAWTVARHSLRLRL